ncbi:MAG: hypothetical protein JO026_02725 [Patescibacteria group bacterium]|nr:hypothetical protein [Patescibacteria group bacterium]
MKELETFLRDLPDIRPEAALAESIVRRVMAIRNRSMRTRRAVFATLAALSGLSVLPALYLSVREISNSSFASYLSLFLSDGSAAFGNWRELLFSLLESAPAVGAIAFLGTAFVFLISLKAFASYLPRRYKNSYRMSSI